jgi:hypothetical protein
MQCKQKIKMALHLTQYPSGIEKLLAQRFMRRAASWRFYGFSGGAVFVESSVLVTVPSGDWVTVFSFDLTVPSSLTVLLLVLDTSRSHPTNRSDNAKADVASVVSHKRLELFSLIFPHSGTGTTGLDPLQRLFTPL